MSVFNEEEFKEGLVSELELFDLPGTQTSVNEIYNEEIRPLSAISGDGPYEFRINAQHSHGLFGLEELSTVCQAESPEIWRKWFDHRTRVYGELVPAESIFRHRGYVAEQSQYQ